MSEEHKKILAIFEKHRASPGAPYDNNHFLDFLLARPKQKQAVYNSFRGLRRFNAFIDEVQLEYAICFSQKDREANYPLEKFVDRVKELRESPRSSLASLRNQMGPYNWTGAIFINLILLVFIVGFRSNIPVLVALVIAAVAINAGFLKFYFTERHYNNRLLQKIQARR